MNTSHRKDGPFPMRYDSTLLPAVFRRREERFPVLTDFATPEGPDKGWCHYPNQGRLLSRLPPPGTPLFLSVLPFNPKKPGGYCFRTEQSEPLFGVRLEINPNRVRTWPGICSPEPPQSPYWDGFTLARRFATARKAAPTSSTGTKKGCRSIRDSIAEGRFEPDEEGLHYWGEMEVVL